MIGNRRPSAGFTLIEAIVAIAITGILSGIVAVFMAKPIQGYVDSVRRAELTDAADVALRRMARDVRLALPNSLRVTTTGGVSYVEFIMTSAGGRYRDAYDGSTGGTAFNWTDLTSCLITPNNCKFDVLGATPVNPTIAVGDFIVVYNLGDLYNPANAYNYNDGADVCRVGGCNVAKVSAVAGNLITLTANPFVAESPPLPSPSSRFQVVPGGVRAVTYACPTAGGNITRYWNYGFNAALATPPTVGSFAVLASGASCVLEYTTNATGRNGVLSIQLTLASGGESVTLLQEVHVDNAP